MATTPGKRPGPGRPKGALSKKTLDKIAYRELVRQRVATRWQSMVDAQIANAEGIKYLVVRERKTGKFIRVTEAMAKVKSHDPDTEEIIEVWEKDPNVQAFADLFNRFIDKPSEHVEVTGADKGPLVVKWQE